MIWHALFVLEKQYLIWHECIFSVHLNSEILQMEETYMCSDAFFPTFLEFVQFCQLLLVQVFYLFQYISQIRLSSRKQQLSLRELHLKIFMVGSSHRRCSLWKGVLINFAKFAGKHLCQSLFKIKLQTSACNFI